MNGLGFERYVATLLRQAGLTVYRSAASRGCADLVVSNDERQYLTVQCKKHGRVRYVRAYADDVLPPVPAPSVGSPSPGTRARKPLQELEPAEQHGP